MCWDSETRRLGSSCSQSSSRGGRIYALQRVMGVVYQARSMVYQAQNNSHRFILLSMRDSIFLLFHTMMKFIKIRDVKTPERAHITDSGIDFYIPNSFPEDFDIAITPNGDVKTTTRTLAGSILLRPGQGVLIPSWIKVIIEPGYDLVFADKSWVATKQNLLIGAKVVDSSYRGEVHIHLINCSDQIQELKLGQKVVQGILRKVELATPEEITEEEFNSESSTDRGSGGFGSTGS